MNDPVPWYQIFIETDHRQVSLGSASSLIRILEVLVATQSPSTLVALIS